MLPKPIRLWLAEMPEDHFQQLKRCYQRMGSTDSWEKFLSEIYEEDKVLFPAAHPSPSQS